MALNNLDLLFAPEHGVTLYGARHELVGCRFTTRSRRSSFSTS
jgi:hypothetical protein